LKFEDLKFQTHPIGHGIQAVAQFDNGYGVSVVRFKWSYGYEEGLFELAVLKGNSLCYDTPVTNNVLGYLTLEDVTEQMAAIQALPPTTDNAVTIT